MTAETAATGAAFPGTVSDRKLHELGFDLLDEHRRAIELAGLRPGDRVLDVATGSGRMAFALAAAGCRVITGDISDEVVRETAGRIGALTGEAVTFQVFDATRLDLPDGGTSCAVTANALHHLSDPEKALEEMTRVLAADGCLVVVEFNDRGFEVIDQVHQAVHQARHDPGVISAEAVCDFLRLRFDRVEHHVLTLNNVWVARGRKAQPFTPGADCHAGCFACGQTNRSGLRLRFEPEGSDGVRADCIIDDRYQGYGGVVQGGIVSLLLDSAMTNCLFRLGIQAVTARLQVRFSLPVRTGEPLVVRARLVESRGNPRLRRAIHSLQAAIEQGGRKRATGSGTFLERV